MDYQKAHEKPTMCWADIMTVQLLAVKHLQEGGDITKEQFDSFSELLNTATVVCQDEELATAFLKKARAHGLHIDSALEPVKNMLC